jgi:hypothetical protein
VELLVRFSAKRSTPRAKPGVVSRELGFGQESKMRMVSQKPTWHVMSRADRGRLAAVEMMRHRRYWP